MERVTIRELRNKGGDVIDRVAAGAQVTVTRDGRPVAELRPAHARGVPAAMLLEHWRRLPPIDPVRLRADVDEVLEPHL